MEQSNHSSSGHRKHKKRHRKRSHKNKANASAADVSNKEVVDEVAKVEAVNGNANDKLLSNRHQLKTNDSSSAVIIKEEISPNIQDCLLKSDNQVSLHSSTLTSHLHSETSANVNEINIKRDYSVSKNTHPTALPNLIDEESCATSSKLTEKPYVCPYLKKFKIGGHCNVLQDKTLHLDIKNASPDVANSPNKSIANKILSENNLRDFPLDTLKANLLSFRTFSQKDDILTKPSLVAVPSEDALPSLNFKEDNFSTVPSVTEENVHSLEKETEGVLNHKHTGRASVKFDLNLNTMEKPVTKMLPLNKLEKKPASNDLENKVRCEKLSVSTKEKKNDAVDETVKVQKTKQEKKCLNDVQKTNIRDTLVSKSCTDATESPDVPQKSKAELRAERRALQEAQRAAKAAAKAKSGLVVGHPNGVIAKPKPSPPLQKDFKPVKAEKDVGSSKENVKTIEKPATTILHKKIQFFSHLQQFKKEKYICQELVFADQKKVHPAIVQLGLQYGEGIIVGSNARCVALLYILKKVIADYVTPPKKELHRDLEEHINTCVCYLQKFRPLSVSMENAVKFLKWHVTQMLNGLNDTEAKKSLQDAVDSYIDESVILADKAIAGYALSKINENDVIMTYGHSSVINTVLIAAHKEGKEFRVVVVDNRPKMEGKETLITLVKEGIKCSYVLINALSYTMQKVTKVFLGAHALLANGYVMGRVGSSQVALVAKAYNVPVLICCETHKFSDRVQTDSFVYNELGNPEDLVNTNEEIKHLENWQNISSLNVLNLAYDVTPPELVSVVVTELGMLPCTSVPVVLRVKHTKS